MTESERDEAPARRQQTDQVRRADAEPVAHALGLASAAPHLGHADVVAPEGEVMLAPQRLADLRLDLALFHGISTGIGHLGQKPKRALNCEIGRAHV